MSKKSFFKSYSSQSNFRKVILRVIINSVIGLLLIYIWSRFIDIGEVLSHLRDFELTTAGIFFLLFIMGGLLRSLRLKLLLKRFNISLKDIVLINFLSQFLSYMIPIRLGEMTKSVYLSTQYNFPLGKSITWVFLDRFLDFWVVLILILSLLIITPTFIPEQLSKTLGILFIVFTGVPIIALSSERVAKKLIDIVSNLIPVGSIKSTFVTFSYNIIEGFSILRRSFFEFTLLLFTTIIAALLDSLIWLYLFETLGIKLEYSKALMGTLLTALSFIIPSAPGYVGSVEAVGLGVFGGMLGVSANLASAAAVLFHILSIISIAIVGLSSLYFLKFDLNLVWKRLRGQ